jgi:hypothetical protein
MKIKQIWAALLGMSLALAACGPDPAQTNPTPQPDVVLTAAAQTAEARLTELAQSTATPTETPVPTILATIPLTPTLPITGTFPITPTLGLGTTPTASALTTPGAASTGDLAAFSADVTIPDGTEMQPGEAFVKTWRLLNSGTTTWTTDYSLAFLGGDQMGGPDAVPLTQSVAPGASVDISVNLVAPQGAGTSRSNWEMRNAAGQFFPTAIYVEIVVGGGAGGTPVAATTPAAGSGQVSNATLIVDNPTPDECPYTFTFTASFTLSQPATVTYQLDVDVPFEADLPASQSNSFDKAGTQTVAYTLDFSGTFDGSAQFRVTAPNEVSSNTVTFACS